jgi:phenylalanyl-tRNA synthetase beta chain
MKVSYNWLKDFVEFDIDAFTLAEKLTLVGFEVEDVIKKSLDYPGIIVGKVLKKERHPNADKLTVCKVGVNGGDLLTIICGAPNVAEEQIVPVALVGSELPNGMKIRKAKIRGVESEGMICSREELELEKKSEGIWVLPDNLAIGEPLAKALAFETEYIIDISVTPNRPDVLSHIGIAREVAAIAGKSYHIPQAKVPEIAEKTADYVRVEILSPETCPRYAARLIRNVKIGPSPDWMVKRLEAVGMRAINNIVDITNYVLMETGHPLHAFDYDLIKGGKIVVRESEDGEYFVTLDEKGHELRAGTVMICDAERAVAVGGIMGGLNSEVNDQTRNVLLESAYFQPESIQKSARYLGISSEASQRFERGADPGGVLYAQSRAAQLMVELAGGECYRGVVDNYPNKIHPVKIDLKVDQINRLLGTNLPRQQMIELLAKIDIRVKDGKVIAPTFRPDILKTADIAEEVGRLFGYDNIPVNRKTELPYNTTFNPFDDYLDQLRDILIGAGYQEVVTNSMINSRNWEKITPEAVYPILNPISNDMNGLRNSLIPGLLGVLQWNINRQINNLAIFELNRVYFHPGDTEHQPREEYHLAVAVTGIRAGDMWFSDHRLFDFYDIKGAIEYLCRKISLDNLQFIPYDNFAVESQAIKIVAGDREIGYCGKVRDSLRNQFDIENHIYVAELNVQTLYDLQRSGIEYQEIPKFPVAERDLAILVNEFEEASKLIETIYKTGGKFLQKIFVFDTYTGKQIDPGKKSLAFRLIFQSNERTLTESEVNDSIENILQALKSNFDANLRS